MHVRSLGPLRPTQLMKEIIYIKTNRLGFIPQVRMQGPIITPIPVTREVAKSMIVAGIEIYEVYKNKAGNKQVRLLTLQNVYPGEGKRPEEPVHNKGGEKKPQVPTSGVVQQEPVQPVALKGMNVSEEKNPKENIPNSVEENMEEPVQPVDSAPAEEQKELSSTGKEEKPEEKENSDNSQKQNKPNNGNRGEKRNKNKNK